MIDGRRGRTRRRREPEDVPSNALTEEHGGETPPQAETPSSARPSTSLLSRIALGRRLVAIGVTADEVTLVGIVLAAATGAVIALGPLWVGVGLITVGGLMDTLDGAVAKAGGTSSRRGAFFDSVSDRVADALIFGGVAYYLAAGRHPALALLPFAILAVGNVISYERAKAESFGWEAKGGLMERAERLIGLAVALAFNVVLVPLLWTLLALCVFTALQRFFKVWNQATAELRGEAPSARAHPRGAAASAALAQWRPARVESRWRAWREARAAGTVARTGSLRTTRTRSRRRSGAPLSTRLRSVLASDRAGGSARATRTGTNARLSRRRRDGAATALRRRLGQGR